MVDLEITSEASLEQLRAAVETTPQEEGLSIYSLPLNPDLECYVGTAAQFPPHLRWILAEFAADVYDNLGYLSGSAAHNSLVRADYKRMLAESDLTHSDVATIRHVLVVRNDPKESKAFVQAMVRMVPSSGRLDAPFDINGYPTGALFSNPKFPFPDEVCNGEVEELSRLISIGEVWKLRSHWQKTQTQSQLTTEQYAFLQKYLPEDAIYPSVETSSGNDNWGRLGQTINRYKRQIPMMLLMLSVYGDTMLGDFRGGRRVRYFIGNLTQKGAGKFLHMRGGIDVHCLDQEGIRWDSLDVQDIFYPYMSQNDGGVLPFYFSTGGAMENARGLNGQLMKLARRILRIGDSVSP